MKWPYLSLIFFQLCILAGCKDTINSDSSKYENSIDWYVASMDWEELCRLKDCSEFPIGFITYDHGISRYYFPISIDLKLNQFSEQSVNFPYPRAYSTRPEAPSVKDYYTEKNKPFIFVPELDAQGNIIRAYRYETADFANINYFFQFSKENSRYALRSLDSSFPIINAIPNAYGSLGVETILYHPNHAKPEAISIVKPSRLEPDRIVVQRTDTGYNVVTQPPTPNIHIRSIEDVVEANFPIFEDKFYVLDISSRENSRGRRKVGIELLSKNPIFFNRHILISCSGFNDICKISTVYFIDEPKDKAPVVFLNWVRFKNYTANECKKLDWKKFRYEGDISALECVVGTEDFGTVLDVFQKLEKQLLAFKEKPTEKNGNDLE